MLRFASRRSLLLGLAFVAGSFFSLNAAATVSLVGSPAAWRIQSYPAGTVAFLTPSPCPSGSLEMDPSDTPERSRQFFAAVVAAKAANLKVFVEYDIINSKCIVRTFGVDGP
ncbi:hypothetical protein FHW69_003726 [Luteibacter sp. Sphag1AF]|uniref:hypothetical protein n=1 Tax=Luteibacter sp. Sphag1AF TaxID=2587031 RepID=UPI00161C6B18|nr:hypothetical protein [Luteibacter sp. Sphag1AF]MBB3229077.1 hypothetical protein [Luteibacter sp. Sphag1AF]